MNLCKDKTLSTDLRYVKEIFEWKGVYYAFRDSNVAFLWCENSFTSWDFEMKSDKISINLISQSVCFAMACDQFGENYFFFYKIQQCG